MGTTLQFLDGPSQGLMIPIYTIQIIPLIRQSLLLSSNTDTSDNNIITIQFLENGTFKATLRTGKSKKQKTTIIHLSDVQKRYLKSWQQNIELWGVNRYKQLKQAVQNGFLPQIPEQSFYGIQVEKPNHDHEMIEVILTKPLTDFVKTDKNNNALTDEILRAISIGQPTWKIYEILITTLVNVEQNWLMSWRGTELRDLLNHAKEQFCTSTFNCDLYEILNAVLRYKIDASALVLGLIEPAKRARLEQASYLLRQIRFSIEGKLSRFDLLKSFESILLLIPHKSKSKLYRVINEEVLKIQALFRRNLIRVFDGKNQESHIHLALFYGIQCNSRQDLELLFGQNDIINYFKKIEDELSKYKTESPYLDLFFLNLAGVFCQLPSTDDDFSQLTHRIAKMIRDLQYAKLLNNQLKHGLNNEKFALGIFKYLNQLLCKHSAPFIPAEQIALFLSSHFIDEDTRANIYYDHLLMSGVLDRLLKFCIDRPLESIFTDFVRIRSIDWLKKQEADTEITSRLQSLLNHLPTLENIPPLKQELTALVQVELREKGDIRQMHLLKQIAPFLWDNHANLPNNNDIKTMIQYLRNTARNISRNASTTIVSLIYEDNNDGLFHPEYLTNISYSLIAICVKDLLASIFIQHIITLINSQSPESFQEIKKLLERPSCINLLNICELPSYSVYQKIDILVENEIRLLLHKNPQQIEIEYLNQNSPLARFFNILNYQSRVESIVNKCLIDYVSSGITRERYIELFYFPWRRPLATWEQNHLLQQSFSSRQSSTIYNEAVTALNSFYMNTELTFFKMFLTSENQANVSALLRREKRSMILETLSLVIYVSKNRSILLSSTALSEKPNDSFVFTVEENQHPETPIWITKNVKCSLALHFLKQNTPNFFVEGFERIIASLLRGQKLIEPEIGKTTDLESLRNIALPNDNFYVEVCMAIDELHRSLSPLKNINIQNLAKTHRDIQNAVLVFPSLQDVYNNIWLKMRQILYKAAGRESQSEEFVAMIDQYRILKDFFPPTMPFFDEVSTVLEKPQIFTHRVKILNEFKELLKNLINHPLYEPLPFQSANLFCKNTVMALLPLITKNDRKVITKNIRKILAHFESDAHPYFARLLAHIIECMNDQNKIYDLSFLKFEGIKKSSLCDARLIYLLGEFTQKNALIIDFLNRFEQSSYLLPHFDAIPIEWLQMDFEKAYHLDVLEHVKIKKRVIRVIQQAIEQQDIESPMLSLLSNCLKLERNTSGNKRSPQRKIHFDGLNAIYSDIQNLSEPTPNMSKPYSQILEEIHSSNQLCSKISKYILNPHHLAVDEDEFRSFINIHSDHKSVKHEYAFLRERTILFNACHLLLSSFLSKCHAALHKTEGIENEFVLLSLLRAYECHNTLKDLPGQNAHSLDHKHFEEISTSARHMISSLVRSNSSLLYESLKSPQSKRKSFMPIEYACHFIICFEPEMKGWLDKQLETLYFNILLSTSMKPIGEISEGGSHKLMLVCRALRFHSQLHTQSRLLTNNLQSAPEYFQKICIEKLAQVNTRDIISHLFLNKIMFLIEQAIGEFYNLAEKNNEPIENRSKCEDLIYTALYKESLYNNMLFADLHDLSKEKYSPWLQSLAMQFASCIAILTSIHHRLKQRDHCQDFTKMEMLSTITTISEALRYYPRVGSPGDLQIFIAAQIGELLTFINLLDDADVTNCNFHYTTEMLCTKFADNSTYIISAPHQFYDYLYMLLRIAHHQQSLVHLKFPHLKLNQSIAIVDQLVKLFVHPELPATFLVEIFLFISKDHPSFSLSEKYALEFLEFYKSIHAIIHSSALPQPLQTLIFAEKNEFNLIWRSAKMQISSELISGLSKQHPYHGLKYCLLLQVALSNYFSHPDFAPIVEQFALIFFKHFHMYANLLFKGEQEYCIPNDPFSAALKGPLKTLQNHCLQYAIAHPSNELDIRRMYVNQAFELITNALCQHPVSDHIYSLAIKNAFLFVTQHGLPEELIRLNDLSIDLRLHDDGHLEFHPSSHHIGEFRV